MDITKILVDGGPTAIVAVLFIYVLTQLLKNNKEQNEAHRAEVKDMRGEHVKQVGELTTQFTNKLETVSSEFRSGMETIKDSMNDITTELREVKTYVSRHGPSSGHD